MKTKIIFFCSGLALGLFAWLATDRIEAYVFAMDFDTFAESFDHAGFLELPPEYNNEELQALQLTNLQGETKSLGEWVNTNETIFVNMWATWCAPCVAEMPSIENLHAQFGNTVSFFVVSYEPIETIEPFVLNKEWNLPFFSRSEDKELPVSLQSDGIPHTLIIHDGKLLVNHVGFAIWDGEEAIAFMNNLITQ